MIFTGKTITVCAKCGYKINSLHFYTRKNPNCLILLDFGKPLHIKNSAKLKKKNNFQNSPYRMNGTTSTESTYGWHVYRARAKRANDRSGYWLICKLYVSGKLYTSYSEHHQGLQYMYIEHVTTTQTKLHRL